MTVHFLRVGDDGALYKGYENDGLRLPIDVTGSTEGQIVCRHWSARSAFARTNRTTEFYQYTDTPHGHLLVLDPDRHQSKPRSSRSPSACRSPTPSGSAAARPRTARASTLPGCESCCRRPRHRARRSAGRSKAWPSARAARAHPLAAAVRHLPRGRRHGAVRVPRGALWRDRLDPLARSTLRVLSAGLSVGEISWQSSRAGSPRDLAGLRHRRPATSAPDRRVPLRRNRRRLRATSTRAECRRWRSAQRSAAPR